MINAKLSSFAQLNEAQIVRRLGNSLAWQSRNKRVFSDRERKNVFLKLLT